MIQHRLSSVTGTIKAASLHTWGCAATGLAIVIGSLALGPMRAQHHPKPRVIECFSIAKDGDFLLAPVTVNGTPHDFYFDTGCSLCVIDNSLRHAVGRRTGSARMLTVSGVERVDLFQSPLFSIGRLTFDTSDDVVCTNIRNRVQGRNVVGALGVSALERCVVEIDFDKGQVCVLDSVRPDAGIRLDLTWDQRLTRKVGPYVTVDIAGHGPERLQIDTGCIGPESGMLERGLFDALSEDGNLEAVGYTAPVPNISHTNVEMMSRGVVQAISLSGLVRRKAVFCRSAMNALGLGFLSHYIVTFDFKNNALYLKEGERHGLPDRYDLSGLRLSKQEFGFVVKGFLSEGSPAAKAGLRVGDLITKIDNGKSSLLSMFEFRSRLCVPGDHVIMVMRGDRELRMRLSL